MAMLPVSRWPARVVVLIALAWPIGILGVGLLSSKSDFTHFQASDGTQIWSLVGTELPLWLYAFAFVPPAALVLWRARGPNR
jgi:hypothetical protein